MKFVPLLGAELSGSIGGITASHGRGGPYFRVRAIPTNPSTPQQVVIRGFMADLTSLWNDTLTAAQRTDWNTYALNVPLLDPLGNPRNVGGLGMYVRSNIPRLQAGLPRVDAAPIIFNLGPFTNPTFTTFAAAGDTFNTSFAILDDWVNEDDAAMLLYTSRPQNPTINYFTGPYRFTAAILGSVGAPPVPPVVAPTAFAFAVGQRVFVQIRVTRADGRLALPFRGFGLGA